MIDSLFVMNSLDDFVKSWSNDSCLSIVYIQFFPSMCVFFLNCPFMYFQNKQCYLSYTSRTHFQNCREANLGEIFGRGVLSFVATYPELLSFAVSYQPRSQGY